MWYDLHLAGRDGSTCVLRYNPHTSELDGLDVRADDGPLAFSPVQPVAKHAPVGKTRAPKRLKIQMGLACNYACTYCNQAFQIHQATISKMSDVQPFLDQLDRWIEGEPDSIELWGGEPFVYWAKIKLLIPALHARFPRAAFSIITNGSLLDRERLDFIKAYDIGIGISHDGPGQPLRGPDPLEDPEKRRWIEALLAERSGKVGFNVVLTKQSYDLKTIADWFENELGDGVQIGLEGVVTAYDDATMVGSAGMTPAELRALSDGVFLSMAQGSPHFGLSERAGDFMFSLAYKRPLSAVGQKCGMDRPEDIAVDLQGNVMTCQNTGAKGSHKIGHVSDFDNIALNTSTHLSHREECMHCPVVQLCKGSCMYLDGPQFAQSCHNEYALNMGILRGALYQMTGMVLTKVEGDIRRPDAAVPGSEY